MERSRPFFRRGYPNRNHVTTIPDTCSLFSRLPKFHDCSYMLYMQGWVICAFLGREPRRLLESIRIYHEFERRIEKSVPRITVWHQEACRVMTNGGPEKRIFLSYPHTNNRFFFFITTVFIYLFAYFKISFQISRNTLR